MIPVDNDSELMDRLFDFLAPTMEQEDLYLVRSPVCLTLDVSGWRDPRALLLAPCTCSMQLFSLSPPFQKVCV